jgi:Arc/MetJ-type ribon-helix-helix transcriptional regulator
MPARVRRPKISTTIAPENRAFLQSLVKKGKAANLSEAVDRAVSIARRADARRRLEDATTAYYASLSGAALKEEQELERAVGHASSQVDFDGE